MESPKPNSNCCKFFLQLQNRVKGKQSKALQMIVFTCSNCCLREKRKKERSRGKVGGEKEGKRKVCARGLPAQLHFPPPASQCNESPDLREARGLDRSDVSDGRWATLQPGEKRMNALSAFCSYRISLFYIQQL